MYECVVTGDNLIMHECGAVRDNFVIHVHVGIRDNFIMCKCVGGYTGKLTMYECVGIWNNFV